MRGRQILVAIESERVTRIKHGLNGDFQDPLEPAVDYCLDAASTDRTEISGWVSSVLPQRLVDRWRPRIERWNRHPNWVFFFAATIGLPPMWLIGFIAKPIMQMRFWPFTLAGYGLRACRYAVLAIIPILAK